MPEEDGTEGPHEECDAESRQGERCCCGCSERREEDLAEDQRDGRSEDGEVVELDDGADRTGEGPSPHSGGVTRTGWHGCLLACALQRLKVRGKGLEKLRAAIAERKVLRPNFQEADEDVLRPHTQLLIHQLGD